MAGTKVVVKPLPLHLQRTVIFGMDGTHLKGRQEIISFNQQLFDTYIKGSRLVGKVRSVRATKVNEIKLSVPSRNMSFW